MSNQAVAVPEPPVFDRLLNDRLVFLRGEITDESANQVVAQLLHLDADKPDKDITLVVNSPGGSAYAALAIYDAMHWVGSDVATVCCGIAMSGGSLVLCAGAPGKRRALPNSRILIHQPSGAFRGVSTDVEIHARETLRLRAQFAEIYAGHTGRTAAELEAAMERDRFFGPQEARDYGLVDVVG